MSQPGSKMLKFMTAFLMVQGCSRIMCQAGNFGVRGMYSACYVHLHSVNLLPRLQGAIATGVNSALVGRMRADETSKIKACGAQAVRAMASHLPLRKVDRS